MTEGQAVTFALCFIFNLVSYVVVACNLYSFGKSHSGDDMAGAIIGTVLWIATLIGMFALGLLTFPS